MQRRTGVISLSSAEMNQSRRPLQLGDVAPDFTAPSSQGTIDFHDWLDDSWCVFFSHPKDYTPICTTELGRAADLRDAFAKRGVKVLALSVDEVELHHGWIKDINETQHVTVDFPIIADDSREVAELYGMIHPKALDTMTVRTVFIIDDDKRIRLMMTYPASTGRNFEEILRCIDSLQLTDRGLVGTPADWKKGGECIILPTVSDPDVIKQKFGDDVREVRPYLRFVPEPK